MNQPELLRRPVRVLNTRLERPLDWGYPDINYAGWAYGSPV